VGAFDRPTGGKAWSAAFDNLKDIVAMIEIHADLVTSIDQAVVEFKQMDAQDRSVRLPALGNSEERCHAYAQKVDHAVDTLKVIARMFYPKELSSKWIDSLISLASQRYGEEEPFTRFLKDVRGTLLFMRDMRNLIEHPQETSYVKIHDFRLLPSMELVAPNVDIVRSGEAQASGALTAMMVQITEELISIGELFIVLLCAANAKTYAGFPLVVAKLPAGRRPKSSPHQRYSFGIVINGEVQPLMS
jgi:hypothetical protein